MTPTACALRRITRDRQLARYRLLAHPATHYSETAIAVSFSTCALNVAVYLFGQGSVLATVEAPARPVSGGTSEASTHEKAGITRLAQPRWFSVAEVARLHGFGFAPSDLQSKRASGSVNILDGAMPVLGWPSGLNDKVKYQLLGNSMHVGVVRALVMLLLGVSELHE
jgi:site-specific DNA-cytosine methylase